MCPPLCGWPVDRPGPVTHYTCPHSDTLAEFAEGARRELSDSVQGYAPRFARDGWPGESLWSKDWGLLLSSEVPNCEPTSSEGCDLVTVRKCGWPRGTSMSDGQCNEPTTTLYVVRAHALPLHDVNDAGTEMAIALCQRHDPNLTTQTSDVSGVDQAEGVARNRAETDQPD